MMNDSQQQDNQRGDWSPGTNDNYTIQDDGNDTINNYPPSHDDHEVGIVSVPISNTSLYTQTRSSLNVNNPHSNTNTPHPESHQSHPHSSPILTDSSTPPLTRFGHAQTLRDQHYLTQLLNNNPELNVSYVPSAAPMPPPPIARPQDPENTALMSSDSGVGSTLGSITGLSGLGIGFGGGGIGGHHHRRRSRGLLCRNNNNNYNTIDKHHGHHDLLHHRHNHNHVADSEKSPSPFKLFHSRSNSVDNRSNAANDKPRLSADIGVSPLAQERRMRSPSPLTRTAPLVDETPNLDCVIDAPTPINGVTFSGTGTRITGAGLDTTEDEYDVEEGIESNYFHTPHSHIGPISRIRTINNRRARKRGKHHRSNKMMIADTMNKQTPNLAPGKDLAQNDEDMMLSDLVNDDSDQETTTEEEIEEELRRQDHGDESSLSQSEESTNTKLTATTQKSPKKYEFFDKEFELGRVAIVWMHCWGYLVLFVLTLGIFSLFWGAYYRREYRFKNLSFLVIQDDPKIYQDLELPDVFSATLMRAIQLPAVAPQAGWKSRFNYEFVRDPDQLPHVLREKIYNRHYWATIWVKPNSTVDYYKALENGEPFNLTDVYHVMYDSGRQFLGESTFLTASMLALQYAVLKLQPKTITQPLAKALNNTKLLPNAMKSTFIMPILFTKHDLTSEKLTTKPIVLGPLIFGPIYLHIVSVMQVAYYYPLNIRALKTMQKREYIIFRLIVGMMSHALVGLAYTLVNVAFKVDIYSAYTGHCGFLAFWMVTFLLLCAVGAVNENACLLLEAYFPNMIPSFVFFWISSNVATATYPLNLCPKFYRYAYGLPMLNAIEAYSVLLFNICKKGLVWRNYVILICYTIGGFAMLPFSIRLFLRKQDERTKQRTEKLRFQRALRLKDRHERNVQLISERRSQARRRHDELVQRVKYHRHSDLQGLNEFH
ncbi:unnamed protein product [Ambrosiozyma monospora]|uniref:Unnamed protein product n=1 Tax=Ambrosiozyma monospora TaxID=43982 RepID=A0A9W7DH31_AMBMO|nr:unnamed protein product [Ambrosiozyma monospora]